MFNLDTDLRKIICIYVIWKISQTDLKNIKYLAKSKSLTSLDDKSLT